MIPKKIHYCWFGRNSFSPLIEECILTWKEKLPEYEIKLWNEDNIPKNNEYVNKMLEEKKYAFAADYIRFYALFTEGGIYLDIDMEVVKSFDNLLNQQCFLGYESKKLVSAGVIAGVKDFYFFEWVMNAIEDNYVQIQEVEALPRIITKVLIDKNLFDSDIKLYGKEYFYPYNPYDSENKRKIMMYKDVTPHTYAIHHWNFSWYTPQNVFQKFFKRIKKSIKKRVVKIKLKFLS